MQAEGIGRMRHLRKQRISVVSFVMLLLWWQSYNLCFVFFFSSRRRNTRYASDWSSDVCSSDLPVPGAHPDQAGAYERTGPLGDGPGSDSLAHGRCFKIEGFFVEPGPVAQGQRHIKTPTCFEMEGHP